MSEQDERANDEVANDELADIEQHRSAELREMQQHGEQLKETIDDARDAVQAAHNANSMRSSDAQGFDAEEEGPQASG